jgi:NAD(P)-dependent dehydrogenase (short-subunit alcohol dehydrogenase family)
LTARQQYKSRANAAYLLAVNAIYRWEFLHKKREFAVRCPDRSSSGGTIVVTSSSNAIATTGRRSAYTASKRALVGLVQLAALDYAAKGIRVNTLILGTTDAPLVRRAAGMEGIADAAWKIAASQWARSHVPGLRRMATAEEIAAFALAGFRRASLPDRRRSRDRRRQDRACGMMRCCSSMSGASSPARQAGWC